MTDLAFQTRALFPGGRSGERQEHEAGRANADGPPEHGSAASGATRAGDAV
ncbi:hypothetical protein [Frankia nepalensis]|uniref:Uncharacterized protein n=1 Tax=Frankia nepalensis TaxID=1836974 RepID=A0A937RI78_9ACTN|nr:hypothetical protein [Frankia nepalensis]MBL7499617.1 hypothetical protein [Frankia nepalensis]MBL7514540.1 hypothetical protein [Frankia nepalensis]MBL7626843.1 hypothetical protein [Frankia nepalensis]